MTLADGSTVRYVWYRFVDQPALQKAGLTTVQKEALQQRVELIHRRWPINVSYIAPPSNHASVASLDRALIVTPPAGMEVGYVPIVTRQEK